MKQMLTFLLVTLILFSGCGVLPETQTFSVEYYAIHYASSGPKELNITYTVEEGDIISCDGVYIYPPSDEQMDRKELDPNVENCDVEKLKARRYSVPLILTTHNTSVTGKENTGEEFYQWKIIQTP